MTVQEQEIPASLSAFQYPPELFESSTAGQEISQEERVLRMAKFAVMTYLELNFQEDRTLDIARGDTKEAAFITAVKRSWCHKHYSADGLEAGDIELAADSLGLYEIIWPFDEEKMRQEAAAVAAGEHLAA